MCYLSAVSEEVQVSLHQMQLPVVELQASNVGSRAQGSEGTVRVRSLPSVTPLKPPVRKRCPPQVVMARDTERFTGSPMAETEEKKNGTWLNCGGLFFHELTQINPQLDICTVTWLYPSVTVDLVQRHRVAVVVGFSPSTNNDHGVFDQSCGMKEPGQGLHRKEMAQKI